MLRAAGGRVTKSLCCGFGLAPTNDQQFTNISCQNSALDNDVEDIHLFSGPLASHTTFLQKHTKPTTLYGWGRNIENQLGKNVEEPQRNNVHPEKAKIVFSTNEYPNIFIQDISCGSNHTLILLSDKKIIGLGRNLEYALGYDSKPQDDFISSFLYSDISSIHAGSDFSMALSETGQVYSWGTNKEGQLGTDQKNHTYPNKVQNLSEPIRQLATGWGHTIAISDGKAYGWGANLHGQLGIGVASLFENVACEVNLPKGFYWASDFSDPSENKKVTPIRVYCGGCFSMMLCSVETHGNVEQKIMIWGSHKDGKIGVKGIQEDQCTPWVVDITDPQMADCGCDHAIVVDALGTVWGWGFSQHLALGMQNRFVNMDTPTLIQSFPGSIETKGVVCSADATFLLRE